MRKFTLKVRDYPVLQDQYYRCRVNSLSKKGKHSINVALEILSNDQIGRIINVELPLPVRPQGITIAFFRVCGFELEVDQIFEPKEVIGKSIQSRFKATDNNHYDVVSFKTVANKENSRADKPDIK